jgi:DNA-binding CsgD family transcriptional regulator
MSDKPIRVATAAAVLVVAAIAAIVSFVHIEHLAVTHGQTAVAAVLLPVSIDGTVAAASLVMLRAARAGLGTPWLARAMLGLAVAATLAANIGYGLPYGLAGAALSGWPAVAFVGCAEMAIGMVRRARVARVATEGPAATATAQARPRAARRPAATDTEAAILATLASVQDMTNAELARAVGVSTRTARRYRSRLAAVANGHPTG